MNKDLQKLITGRPLVTGKLIQLLETKQKPIRYLLTLVERQTRFEIILKLNGKDKESVDQAINQLRLRAGDTFSKVFKTITSDNGSEFAGLHEALHETLDVYFSHPYASWERGTSENQHKFIRRFIPKGKADRSI